MKFLVFGDNSNLGGEGIWATICAQEQHEVTMVIHQSSKKCLIEAVRILESEEFDGTILDIHYAGDAADNTIPEEKTRYGGITIWESLQRDGLAGKAGALLVATKFSEDGKVQQFARKNALEQCYGFTLSGRIRHFRRFVERIKNGRANA